MHVHFVGIGGIGMVGIAVLALQTGATVSGSDIKISDKTELLKNLGVQVYIGHEKENIQGVNLLVKSAGIPPDNLEIMVAREKLIPIFTRSQFLAKVLSYSDQEVIAICGSYAKSTVTSMISQVLLKYNLDPSIYLGAYLDDIAGYSRLGKGKHAVVEACEYQGEYFYLNPNHIILTSISKNHEDYFGTEIKVLENNIINFIEQNLYRKGTLISCADNDSGNSEILKAVSCNVITYGLNQGDIRPSRVKFYSDKVRFSVRHNGLSYQFITNSPGIHMVQNSLAVIATALLLNIDLQIIQDVLCHVTNLRRRLEKRIEKDKFVFFDDNARIPMQLRSTISALRNSFVGWEISLICGFWGKLNARNLSEFANELIKVDNVYILPVGRASVNYDGAETHDSDIALRNLLLNNVKETLVVGETLDIAEMLVKKINNSDKKQIICTVGYDSYSSVFDQLAKYINDNA